jgi:hypothetical protein
MAELIISEKSGPSDLAPIAIALNEILGLPVTMRSRELPGVRVEGGRSSTKDILARSSKR